MTVTPRLALPLLVPTDSMKVIPAAWKTQFINLDTAMGFTLCLSSAKPGSPYPLQIIFETDTGLHKLWDPIGLSWITLDNPTGIDSVWTASGVPIAGIGTENFILTTTFIINPSHKYRFHLEGWLNNLTNSTNLLSEVIIRLASGASVSSGSPQLSGTFADCLNPNAGSTLQGSPMFQLDGIGSIDVTTATNQATVGVSVIPGGSLGSSGSLTGIVNRLMIEDMGGLS